MGILRTRLKASWAAMLLIATLCGGCWEVIEYTGPDPVAAPRRLPRQVAESQSSDANQAVADQTQAREKQTESEQFGMPVDENPGNGFVDIDKPLDTATEGTDSSRTAQEPLEQIDSPNTVELDDLFLVEDSPLESTDEKIASTEPAAPDAKIKPIPQAEATVSRRLAWVLGSKLSLAAMANDRGLVPEDVTAWMADGRNAAKSLGTTLAELPLKAPQADAKYGSPAMHDYLAQQGQRIWRELADAHGPVEAALFEIAVKSNVLLVLYEPGSSTAEAMARSLVEITTQAELPGEMMQPLLDALANQSPPAAIRSAVRKMHADVEQHLTTLAEQY